MRTQTEERGTITLNKPVLINGVQVAEMSYDTDEISGELYAQAEAQNESQRLKRWKPCGSCRA